MINFTLDSTDYSVEAFRQINVFESFAGYIDRVITPCFLEQDRVTTIRCSISGFPVAGIFHSEFTDMIHHGIRTLKLNRFDDILRAHSDKETANAIETLYDHLVTRVILLARPAPCLSWKGDRLSEVVLSRTRQTAILLNSLLWDSGQFRDTAFGMEDQVERNRKSFAIADLLIHHWDAHAELETLSDLLIELDAKYLIRKLQFSRAEKDVLDTIRANSEMLVPTIIAFVERLIRVRDDRQTELETSTRWTQTVYRENMAYGANEMLERSNILQPPTKVELKKAEARTPEGRAKAEDKREQEQRMAAAFAAAFGSVK